MLENYSVAAQRVVSLATMEARRLDHSRVGTEHLLLGLLSDDDGEPADVLRMAGATLAAARHKVIEALGAGAESPDTEALPFTPRAERALERAGRFSRKDQQPQVTSEHVLLGVLDVEGLACQVLRGLSVDVAQLRDALGPRLANPVAPADDHTSIVAVRPTCPQCHAPLDDTLTETLVLARRECESPSTFRVAYCAACSTTLGLVRPES